MALASDKNSVKTFPREIEYLSNLRYYETVELSHSRFSRIYRFVNDNEGHTFDIDDDPFQDTMADFEPLPFDFNLPTSGSDQQDIKLRIPNLGTAMLEELERAIVTPDEPVRLIYRFYVENMPEMTGKLDELYIVSVVVDNYYITCSATRADMFGRYICQPLFDYKWEGLWL